MTTTDFKFSKPLAERLINYFLKNYDVPMSSEESQLFLASLARLYEALSDARKQAESKIG
jgi:hypothetical protein